MTEDPFRDKRNRVATDRVLASEPDFLRTVTDLLGVPLVYAQLETLRAVTGQSIVWRVNDNRGERTAEAAWYEQNELVDFDSLMMVISSTCGAYRPSAQWSTVDGVAVVFGPDGKPSFTDILIELSQNESGLVVRYRSAPKRMQICEVIHHDAASYTALLTQTGVLPSDDTNVPVTLPGWVTTAPVASASLSATFNTLYLFGISFSQFLEIAQVLGSMSELWGPAKEGLIKSAPLVSLGISWSQGDSEAPHLCGITLAGQI